MMFNNFMYTKQDFYEKQLEKLGLMDKNAFTCTCYMDQVGNQPKKGDILSWAESSAVVYANSVLGARCNRNSGIIDIMGSIVGYVPYFGLLTDEGRKATWVVKVNTTKKPEAQLLGSAIGMKVMEDVPYVVGLDKWIGNELNDTAKAYLKDFGAATASNGAVGLYHIENLTPEAVELGEALIAEGAKEYVIDDAELVQGVGGRVSALISTTPIDEVMDKVGRENILNPETAELNPLKGLEMAIERGYKNIAITILPSKSIEEIGYTITSSWRKDYGDGRVLSEYKLLKSAKSRKPLAFVQAGYYTASQEIIGLSVTLASNMSNCKYNY